MFTQKIDNLKYLGGMRYSEKNSVFNRILKNIPYIDYKYNSEL